MLGLIFSLWLLVILVLSFTKIKWGVALYLAYMILVPVLKLELGPLHLGENVFPFAFLLGYILYANKNHVKTDWRPLAPFIFYYVAALCLMPFQSYVPFGEMINSWRVDVMKTMFLPFVMWNVMKSDSSCVKLYRNTLLVSIAIAVGYGLFLTTMAGFNPYIMSLMDRLGTQQDMERYYDAASTGRIFGRISSVFVHPMSFALFLGLAFIYIFQCRKELNKYISITLLAAIGVASMVCGVRSVLGALVVAVAYYFLMAHNYKMMFTIIVVAIGGSAILSTMPEFSNYIESIADFHNENQAVSGSSVDMRLEQLDGAIREGSKNPIFGLGYGWTHYYMSLYGDHPVMLAFESLIYVIICNFGLAGFVIWAVMIMRYLRNNRKMQLDEVVIFDCLMIFYVSYACITGEYGYMRYFLIFYLLMLGQAYLKNNEQQELVQQ